MNTPCEDGWTALIVAVHFGHVQTTRMLVAAGAEVLQPACMPGVAES